MLALVPNLLVPNLLPRLPSSALRFLSLVSSYAGVHLEELTASDVKIEIAMGGRPVYSNTPEGPAKSWRRRSAPSWVWASALARGRRGPPSIIVLLGFLVVRWLMAPKAQFPVRSESWRDPLQLQPGSISTWLETSTRSLHSRDLDGGGLQSPSVVLRYSISHSHSL